MKPYVKRGKTDAADAEAICEAVTRPTMRFVPVKSAEQQAALMLHRTRDLLVRQRTDARERAARAPGRVRHRGAAGDQPRRELLAVLLGEDEATLPPLARQALRRPGCAAEALGKRIEKFEARSSPGTRSNEASRRLAAIPGIGPITASAIVATVGDAVELRLRPALRGLDWAVPKQNSSGGKARQGGISKAGDRYLRRLLVLGRDRGDPPTRSRHGRAGWRS